jgi:tight adherence protein B
MGLLPLGLGGIITLLSPDYMSAFTQSLAGKAMLGGALLMQLLGFLSIRKITQVKV